MTDSIAADDVAGATVAPEIVGMDGVTTQAANGTAHPEDTAAPAAATGRDSTAGILFLSVMFRIAQRLKQFVYTVRQ